MVKINTLILAGNSEEDFSSEVTNKAMIELKGKWLIEYVIDALRASEYIEEIALVGPVDILKERLEARVDHFIEGSGDIFDNLKEGLKAFDKDDLVLISTSDIPLLTSEAIDDFVRSTSARDKDLYYPIVEKAINEEAFPEFKRTYASLRDGTFTGGNLMAIKPRVLPNCTRFFRRLIANRKKPWVLGRILGLHFVMMLLTRRLTIVHIENRINKLVDIDAKAIISKFPEIANDVDRQEQLDQIIDYLAI